MKTKAMGMIFLALTPAYAGEGIDFQLSVGQFEMRNRPATCDIDTYLNGKHMFTQVDANFIVGGICDKGEGAVVVDGEYKSIASKVRPGKPFLDKYRVEHPSANAQACAQRQQDEAKKGLELASASPAVLSLKTFDIRLTDNTNAAVNDSRLSPSAIFGRKQRLLIRAVLTSERVCRYLSAEAIAMQLETRTVEQIPNLIKEIEKKVEPAKPYPVVQLDPKFYPKSVIDQVHEPKQADTQELWRLIERAVGARVSAE